MSTLLKKLESGYFIPLRNRVVMSAMSRGFATPDHYATDDMRTYYARRAKGGAGLILTEGTVIHKSADGWNQAPYISSDAHAESWRPIVDAVHEAGGAIACQLWHCGRISHSDYTGDAPVSSTNQAAAGINRQNGKPYGEPRALAATEMQTIYGYYVDAAKRSIDVGFDAIELHIGHGYLADQFLDGRVNDRKDEYGGSVENRCRFALELVAEVLKNVPANRVLARISPSRFMGGIYEWPDIDEMLEHFIPQLWRLGLRTIDVSCANSDYFETSGKIIRKIRPNWPGIIMGGASLTQEQAEAELDDGFLDLVTWGRLFMANPDLVEKMESGTPWAPYEDSMREVLS
jgi:2,4-dienoyl-CoA reductase-like NADH-dependent reductase (Old Yellow Enzyme family)